MACTFRPSKDAQKAIEKIKADNDLKTNSKALEYVLTNFHPSQKVFRETQAYLVQALDELTAIKLAIANKQHADSQYNEMVKNLIPKQSAGKSSGSTK